MKVRFFMRKKQMVLLLRLPIMVAGLLWLFVGHLEAQQPRVERLDIVESGFFVYEPVGIPKESEQSVGGIVIRPKNMRFLPESEVKAQIGTSFGARFRSVGAPRDARVTLRTIWRIPAPGVTDPRNGRTYQESKSTFVTRIGSDYFSGYGFNEQWEIVPGVWSLEIWQDDRKLLERKFTIQ